MSIKRDKRDRVFSKIIRTRDGYRCQRCGKKHATNSMGLHCAHFQKRRNKGLRWDERNADSLCYGCHQYFEEHPGEHEAWKVARDGQATVDLLKYLARKVTKYTRHDLEVIHSELNIRLKKLEEGHDREDEF